MAESTPPVEFDRTTFEGLYRMHAPSVLRFALGCVGQRELAEDLASEAFLALYRNLDRVDAARLPAWLFTVVRNRARDYWRRQVVEQRYLEMSTRPRHVEPLPLERWILDTPILKPVHRTCLMLRYAYGMTRKEIASKTGLSEMQVKGYLQYALERLRQVNIPRTWSSSDQSPSSVS